MAEFVMPSLGADMGEGTLIAWRKKVGEAVHRGEIICEVETDKAVIDVECHMDGVIERFLVEPGVKIPVGTPMAVIRTGKDEEIPLPPPAPKAAPPTPGPTPAASTPPPSAKAKPRPPAAGPSVSGRTRISPYAARLAAELGVSLKDVKGTGAGGAISAQDILDTSKSVPPAAEPAPEETPQSRMRRAIAAAMSRSKREIPHYYLSHTIDLEPALAWISAENEKRPVEERLLPAVILLKATALALREVPELNALWEGGRAVTKDRIHVGAAVVLRGGGLIAPALHDVDKAGIGDLMDRLRDLVQRVRSGKLRSSELTDSTITVTSLGDQGVESLFGVIYPPQVAIVGFGTPAPRPWVVDGKVTVRRTITSTLSADHRVTDGHRGAQFLTALEKLLREPEKLR